MAKGTISSAPVTPAAAPKVFTRLFIGSGWHNVSKKDPTMHYTNIVFKRGFEVIVKDLTTGLNYTLSGKDGMLAFPGRKRDGKQDPDLSLSISTI